MLSVVSLMLSWRTQWGRALLLSSVIVLFPWFPGWKLLCSCLLQLRALSLILCFHCLSVCAFVLQDIFAAFHAESIKQNKKNLLMLGSAVGDKTDLQSVAHAGCCKVLRASDSFFDRLRNISHIQAYFTCTSGCLFMSSCSFTLTAEKIKPKNWDHHMWRNGRVVAKYHQTVLRYCHTQMCCESVSATTTSNCSSVFL